MNPILRNILAVICGFVVGSIVNMGILNLGTSIIPPPANADISTMEGLKASMHLFEPKNFLFPFLAHAFGTFAGALTAAFIAKDNKLRAALIVGALFLVGGIISVFMLPSPLWYSVVDVVFAYIPFSYLAGKIASREKA